jgi:hypothetical protein
LKLVTHSILRARLCKLTVAVLDTTDSFFSGQAARPL